ncbi:uncharacterized protein LOC134256149 [Saccostrea cucullata]|uniref:uncharacterized protein LOC134256149 n=1 Tax=Saccostrea cuccullata TaxID=36930 RepID=UPI002ED46102
MSQNESRNPSASSSRDENSRRVSSTDSKPISIKTGTTDPKDPRKPPNRPTSQSSASPPTRSSSQNSLSPPIRSPVRRPERPFSEKSLLSRSLSYERVPRGSLSVRRISDEIPRGSPVSFAFPHSRDRLPSFSTSRSRSNSDATIPEEPLLFEITEIKKLKSAERDFNRKGVVWTTDGRLVIINFGNEQLKVFDENFQETICKQIPEGCRGISVGAGVNDVVITCHKRVYNYQIYEKTISEGKCFVLNGNGYGVSFARYHFGVTVNIGGESKCVAILNDEGKVVQQLEKIQRPNETHFKAFHLYITMDPNRNVMYLSDVNRDKLLCVSYSEKLYWEKELPGKPRGICVVGLHVIVATTGGKLCVFTKDGSLMKVWPNLGYDPESIAYDEDTHRLAVSQYYKGWVHIYQLK